MFKRVDALSGRRDQSDCVLIFNADPRHQLRRSGAAVPFERRFPRDAALVRLARSIVAAIRLRSSAKVLIFQPDPRRLGLVIAVLPITKVHR